MNKTEYLNALKEALKDTDESIMEEIVSDYEEHFQVGMEYGKSEEQICEELGSIDDLVEEIKEVYHANSKDEKKANDDQANTKNSKYKEWYSGIHNIDGEKIGDAINSALDTAGGAISKIDVNEIGRTVKNTLDQATSSINHFASNYFKNQGKDSWDHDNRNTEWYKENITKSYDDSVGPEAGEEKVSYDAQTFSETSSDVHIEGESQVSERETPDNEQSNEQSVTSTGESNSEDSKNGGIGLNLDIDGLYADINVQKSSNGKININYENNGDERQRQMYEFYSYKEGNTVYAGIRRVGKAVFLFNFKLYSTAINVELPDNMGNINIKTASGSINIADVNSESIRVTTASGDIEAENLETKFLSLKTASGDIDARNVIADVMDNSSLSGSLDIAHIKAGECKIRSTSGDIEIKDFIMDNADVSGISSDIKLSRIIGDGLRVTSTSGDISLDMNVKKCYLSSKSGDIKANCKEDIILESNNTSGDIEINLRNNNKGYSLKSRTVSGDLYIDYDNMRQRSLKTGTYTYGSQGSELILSTVSGDIHLYD